MSKTLKWILGILLVLVLVAGMFATGFMWQTHRTVGWDESVERGWNMPMFHQPSGEVPAFRVHPMMGVRSFHPFGGFFALGGLLKLVVFLGLLYGAYWLGRRNARITVDPQPVPSEPVTPALESESESRKRAKKTE